MQNPFMALGLPADASQEQIRAAYHALAKCCHPDSKRGRAEQLDAQQAMVDLNIAYKEALRQAVKRKDQKVVIPDAKQVAQKLFEQGMLDSALRILNKAPERDAGWFALQGQILLKKGEAEAAHGCFRTAVRLDPKEGQYRQLALDAAVAMRKKNTLRGKVGSWAKGVVSRVL